MAGTSEETGAIAAVGACEDADEDAVEVEVVVEEAAVAEEEELEVHAI